MSIYSLSIIIISYNTRDLLDECLHSIYQHHSHDDIEVIVVDNASPDDSVAMVKSKYSQVKIIKNRSNAGFAKANNQGLKESSGRYVMFLNSDTLVQLYALDRIVTFLNQHTNVHFLGPKLLNVDGSLQVSAFKVPTLVNSIGDMTVGVFDIPLFTSIYAKYDKIMPVGWVSGACLVARKESLNKLGGWDETFFMYSEDVLMGIRASQKGFTTWYFPEAEIVHLKNKSSKNFPKRVLQVYKSRIMLRKMYFHPIAFITFWLCMEIAISGRIVFYSLNYGLRRLLRKEASFERQRIEIYVKVLTYHLEASFRKKFFMINTPDHETLRKNQEEK